MKAEGLESRRAIAIRTPSSMLRQDPAISKAMPHNPNSKAYMLKTGATEELKRGPVHDIRFVLAMDVRLSARWLPALVP